MVSTITPNTAGANALGVAQRFVRDGQQAPSERGEAGRTGDSVNVSSGDWSAARESVRNGLTQVHQALALGHDAQAMLVQVLQIARAGGADAQTKLSDVLAAYQQRVDAASAQGATAISGQAVSVQAEPGAAVVEVAGADLRLQQTPDENDIIQISADAQADDPDLAHLAQTSLDALQQAMEKLLDAARSLEAHQGFLGAAEGATAVRSDLGADSARLMALQVRQGLEAIGNAPIANVEPQAVLALFRA